MTSDDLENVLKKRARQAVHLPDYRPSAVLALLVADEPEHLESARLVFTVRRADLRTHAGQISFPGGRRDDSDADLSATALRETREELGVPPERVHILGALDDVPTPARYVITPYVGVARSPLSFVPHDGEVAEVFECALPTLREPARYVDAGTRSWQGVEYVLHEYHFGGHRIWGATARMVHQLLGLVER